MTPPAVSTGDTVRLYPGFGQGSWECTVTGVRSPTRVWVVLDDEEEVPAAWVPAGRWVLERWLPNDWYPDKAMREAWKEQPAGTDFLDWLESWSGQ